MDIKPNFFSSTAKPAPVTMPVIQWVNDPKYRRDFGQWLYENFDTLISEYKTHGRFLSLQELQDSPLE
jgi:hypothetical protein